MLRVVTNVIGCLTFVLLLLPVSCNSEEKHIPGVAYYYGTFSGYNVPFKPSEPITYEVAIKRTAYYIAYYDAQDRLTSFAKYLHGNPLFSVKYFYRESGTLERKESVDENGKTTIQYYDEKGKLIRH